MSGTRLLDASVLAQISSLDLVAKTVVEGFLTGLHRSPAFGFSQEFAEYRPYTPGDDPRFVDWNVYARTDRVYLKQYQGETNAALLLLFDASASMGYGSGPVTKMEYARFLAASLAYLAVHQRDPAGLVVFDEEVRAFVPPSLRHGQLPTLLAALEHAQPSRRTDVERALTGAARLVRRRGLVAVVSDFYDPPEHILRALAPLTGRGHDLVLFHVLDPVELDPGLREPVRLEDMETGRHLEVGPRQMAEYRTRLRDHIDALRRAAGDRRADYQLLDTSKPLDAALREYLRRRERTGSGLSYGL
jgi:uncharacterized protein (DUF58 family)